VKQESMREALGRMLDAVDELERLELEYAQVDDEEVRKVRQGRAGRQAGRGVLHSIRVGDTI
jgi:hypothetical protein